MPGSLKNARHEKFVRGIVSGLSATAAYIKAGYSKAGADVSASRLLGKASVRARLDELSAKITEKTVDICIANRLDRLAALDRRWHSMQQIQAERAVEMVKDGKPVIAGAGTGMLVRTFRNVGIGLNAKVIPEYAFDVALFKEMRETELQAAKETGQFTEKREITGKDGGPLTVELFDEWLENAETE